MISAKTRPALAAMENRTTLFRVMLYFMLVPVVTSSFERPLLRVTASLNIPGREVAATPGSSPLSFE
jgi:hypothetical protein